MMRPMKNSEAVSIDTRNQEAELPEGAPPLYETDLYIPMYQDGRWGDWEIRVRSISAESPKANAKTLKQIKKERAFPMRKFAVKA